MSPIACAALGLCEHAIIDGHQLGGDAYCLRLAFARCGPIHFLQVWTANSLGKQIRSMHGESRDFLIILRCEVLTSAQDLQIAKELAAEREKETEEV
jgi:hypothetical protein